MSFATMTMEEIFIVTWLGTAIIGIALGFLAYWFLEKDAQEEDLERCTGCPFWSECQGEEKDDCLQYNTEEEV